MGILGGVSTNCVSLPKAVAMYLLVPRVLGQHRLPGGRLRQPARDGVVGRPLPLGGIR